MKVKIISLGVFLLLVLIAINNVNAVVIKNNESKNEQFIELKYLMLDIQDLFDNIKKDFSEKEYNELFLQVESSLKRSIFTDENGLKVVDLDIFEKELNSPPSAGVRNVVRFYDIACIYADTGSYSILRTPYSDWLYSWQYKWIFKSNSYSIKIYENWEENSGDLPTPLGVVSLYGKKVYAKGWIGWHIPPEDGEGLGGLAGKVFAIGSATNPNVKNRYTIQTFLTNILLNFPLFLKLLKIN